MSDDTKQIFIYLREPFPSFDIEWRVQASGKDDNGNIWARVFAYVTNRAIQERLDEVVGPRNWCNEYKPAPDGGVLCGLSLRVDNEWLTKWDGAENSAIEAVKGGLSGAMKRAAVQWGIGRYLYGVPNLMAEISRSGKHYARLPQKFDSEGFRWNPPELPAWALPDEEQAKLKIKIDIKAKKLLVQQTLDMLAAGDAYGLKEIWAEWSSEEQVILWKEFNSQQRAAIKALLK